MPMMSSHRSDDKAASVASIARETLRLAILRDGIVRSDTQRLLSPGGRQLGWLLDLRSVFMDPLALTAAATLFWETCAELLPFQIGGMEMAAVPLLTAILVESVARGTPVSGFIVRKERKLYGTGSLIEGKLTNQPVLIVDDLLNSGSSLDKVRLALENEGKQIASVYVLVDFLTPTGLNWRKNHLITIQSAFMLPDFNLRMDSPQPERLAQFQTVWSFASPDPNFFHRVPKSFPVVEQDRIYFGSDCGAFWCLRTVDASVVWQFRVHTPDHKNLWSSPALHAGQVFFGSYDGNVYCLDAKTGALRWRCDAAEWIGSSPALAPDLDLLFIGLEYAVEGKRGGVAALRLGTGEKVWEHETKRFTHASPAYWPEREVVACGSNDNEMLLLDAKTGELRWRFQVPAVANEIGSIRHAPAFDQVRNRLVTGCANGCIYVIDVDSGLEVWSVRTGGTIYTVPLVVGDLAYVGSTDKFLYILDLEQKVVKTKLNIGAKIYGPPRLLADRIYFGANNGRVYELSKDALSITGTHQLPDAITNALAYDERKRIFFALTYLNQMYAFIRKEP